MWINLFSFGRIDLGIRGYLMKYKALLILTWFFFLLVACSSPETTTHSFDLKGDERYSEDYPYSFKLPTYLSFEIKGINIIEMGERKSPPKGYTLELTLYGKNIKSEHIWIRIVDFGKIENRSGENEQELQLGDGTEAKYFYNGRSQILAWNDKDLMYSISIALGDNKKERYTIEELIKIADSFEPYQ
jgi:hypothetical protein